MYRYTVVAIAVFVAGSVDSRSIRKDNDTQKGPQKSPGEPQLTGFSGASNNVAPWSSNGGYGSGAPNGRPCRGCDGAGGYGWRTPGMEGSFAGADQNGGPYGPPSPIGSGPYGPRYPMGPGPNRWQNSSGGHKGGPDSMEGFNGWKGSYMGGYGCRGCGTYGHGYGPAGGYNGWSDFMGGFNEWKGPDMGGYGCRGCGRHDHGYGHDHQHHHRHHEHHGHVGGRPCEHCGHETHGEWGAFGGNGENGGYSAPSDMGSYGYGGYGHDNRGYGYGYGHDNRGYGYGYGHDNRGYGYGYGRGGQGYNAF